MEQQFYTFFSTAKRYLSTIRLLVGSVFNVPSPAIQKTLTSEISKILSQLYLCRDFFKKEGKKTEVDLLIIFYTTLLRRLDSS